MLQESQVLFWNKFKVFAVFQEITKPWKQSTFYKQIFQKFKNDYGLNFTATVFRGSQWVEK